MSSHHSDELKIGSRFTVEGVECVVVPAVPEPKIVVAGEVSLANDVLRGVDYLMPVDGMAKVYRAMLRACEEKE